ncbi:MAG TPA: CBS domain-containing protein [Candidatus Acidoferrum sp.]|nr:CBS domain-containing protein [Candidatus Acidoferrum sp.]
MKVREVMSEPAITCGANANIGQAVQLMWEQNCGLLPVIGEDGKLTGVVTDRDICIAMGTRNRLPGDLTVGEIATQKVHTCKPNDDIHEALSTIATMHVRRLPVVDANGVPQGLLSMDDILLHGDLNKWEGYCELSSEEILRSLKALYEGQLAPAPVRAVAA